MFCCASLTPGCATCSKPLTQLEPCPARLTGRDCSPTRAGTSRPAAFFRASYSPARARVGQFPSAESGPTRAGWCSPGRAQGRFSPLPGGTLGRGRVISGASVHAHARGERRSVGVGAERRGAGLRSSSDRRGSPQPADKAKTMRTAVEASDLDLTPVVDEPVENQADANIVSRA